MALLTDRQTEGHYRLISHNEKGEAIYARIENGKVAEWVRNWREATTFLTMDQAVAARASAKAVDADRDITIAQRFREWPRKARPSPEAAR